MSKKKKKKISIKYFPTIFLLPLDGIAITEPLAASDAVIVGDNILLKCMATSVEDIEVIFTWYRSQHKLNSNTPRTSIVREKKSSILTIVNSTSKDAGYYTCKAQWTNKSVERKIFIIVTGKHTFQTFFFASPTSKTFLVYQILIKKQNLSFVTKKVKILVVFFIF